MSDPFAVQQRLLRDLSADAITWRRRAPGEIVTFIRGSLTKEEIGRVIRRNLARFKYCYQKQLNANPNLQGKVAV
jgi:hypothetical protein